MEQDLHQNAIEYLQSLTRKQSNCSMRYEDGMIVVDELTPISEETAKAFEKSCNDYLETLSEVSKSLNPCLERLIEHLGKTSKRKARKYYKPKFTL